MVIENKSLLFYFQSLSKRLIDSSSVLKNYLSRYPNGFTDDNRVLLTAKNPLLGLLDHNVLPSKFYGYPNISGYKK